MRRLGLSGAPMESTWSVATPSLATPGLDARARVPTVLQSAGESFASVMDGLRRDLADRTVALDDKSSECATLRVKLAQA